MAVLSVHVSDETLERLTWFAGNADSQGPRSVEELAEAAIAEAALSADTRPLRVFGVPPERMQR